MKYYLIAGEASGDLHGSNLMKGLKKNDASAQFRFLGGDLMQQQGGALVQHYRNMAYMGLIEVLAHLRTILRNFSLCENDLLQFNPDVLILIDYPGFNLKMAKFAKKHGIKVFYYISPKVWAWKESRVTQIKKYVDKLFVIFPFEVVFFKKHGMEVEYCGNPLTDVIDEYKKSQISKAEFIKQNNLSGKPIIALIAGSRKHEISLCLPEMLKAMKNYTGYELVISGAPNIKPEFYYKVIGTLAATVLFGQTYNVMSFADAAIVTSGTATLETALLKTPQVVIYKANLLTYSIAKPLFKIRFFSLVNIILGFEAVKELLQFNLAAHIELEIKKITNNNDYRQTILECYTKLENMLHEGEVSLKVAGRMIELMSR